MHRARADQDVFRAIADPTRRAILDRLRAGRRRSTSSQPTSNRPTGDLEAPARAAVDAARHRREGRPRAAVRAESRTAREGRALARGLSRVLAAQPRQLEALPGGYMTRDASRPRRRGCHRRHRAGDASTSRCRPSACSARSPPRSSRSGGARDEHVSHDEVRDRARAGRALAQRRRRRRWHGVPRRGRGPRGRSAAEARPDLEAVVGATARRRRSRTRSTAITTGTRVTRAAHRLHEPRAVVRGPRAGWERVLGWLGGHFRCTGDAALLPRAADPPPRPTFVQDMTPDERAMMQEHGVYWRGKLGRGRRDRVRAGRRSEGRVGDGTRPGSEQGCGARDHRR